MLGDPAFSVKDVPTKFDDMLQFRPRVRNRKQEGETSKQCHVSTPSLSFAPVSNVPSGDRVVPMVRPLHFAQILLGLPLTSRYLTAKQQMPLELADKSVPTFANSLAWALHPFSGINIPISYFHNAGFDERVAWGSFLSFVDSTTAHCNLGRVDGMYVDDSSDQLWLILELHTILEERYSERGALISTNWCALEGDPGSFSAVSLVAAGGRVLSVEEQLSNPIVCSFTKTKLCPACGNWGKDNRDYDTGLVIGVDTWCCPACESIVDVSRYAPYSYRPPFSLKLPPGVREGDVIVLPCNIGGDEFNMYRTTGEKVDTYPFIALGLPPEIRNMVKSSLPWVAFPDSMSVRERLFVIAQAVADAEKGGWVYHCHDNSYRFVVVAVPVMGSDMAAGAGYAGTLNAANASFPSRQSLLPRHSMLRPEQIRDAQRRTRELEERERAAASLLSPSAGAKHLASLGFQPTHSPLLALRTMYALSQQIGHCFLHVFSLGDFHFLAAETIQSLAEGPLGMFLAGLRCTAFFCAPLPARLCELEVADGKSGKVVRGKGHKLNGGDVELLMPGLGMVVELVLRNPLALREDVRALWDASCSEHLAFWQQQIGCERPTPNQMLVCVWRRFCAAYGMCSSLHSAAPWEKDVEAACSALLDCIRLSPLAVAFKNKPKAMAMLELSLQRALFGSARSFSMDTVESTHTYSRTVPTNNATPELFVIANTWSQLLTRYLVERGRFGVFDIELDPATGRPRHPDAGDSPGFSIGGELATVLQRVFGGGLPARIASFPPPARVEDGNWVTARTIPKMLLGRAGMLRGFIRVPFEVPQYVGWVFGVDLQQAVLLNGRFVWATDRVVEFKSLELGRLELRPAQHQRVIERGMAVVLANGQAFRVRNICACRKQSGLTYVVLVGQKLARSVDIATAVFAHLDAFQVLHELWVVDPLLVHSIHLCIQACSSCVLSGDGRIAHMGNCTDSRIRLLDAWVPKPNMAPREPE